MNKETARFIKVLKYKSVMSDLEKETLLSDLIAVAVSEGLFESELLPYLLCDNFEGFQKHIKHINKVGNEIKQNLK